MDRALYPAYRDDWDNQRFRQLVDANLQPQFVILDFGAGRGALAEMSFRGRVGRVAGVDPDLAVLENPDLDEAKVLPLPSGEIPYPDETFDLVFTNNVIEHLEDPRAAFRELFRVLKSGGVLIAKTPNSLHYVPLIARWTPHAFHVFINRLRGRSRQDTFPTCYRCNTPGALARVAGEAGFSIEGLEMWEGRPEYLRMAAPLYLLGWLYERLVNATSHLARFRCVMVAVLRKPRRSAVDERRRTPARVETTNAGSLT